MKRKIVLAAMMIVPLFASAADTAESIPKIGVGVGVSLGTILGGVQLAGTPVALYVPINASEHFRIEPSFGFWYNGNSASAAQIAGSTSAGQFTVEFGVGGFYVLRPIHPFAIYLGGRVGVDIAGASTSTSVPGQATQSTSQSQVDLFINPAAGVEWSIIRAFSIGFETQVPFKIYFSPSLSVNGQPVTTGSSSAFATGLDAFFFTRFYF